jgi:hypothetical protein
MLIVETGSNDKRVELGRTEDHGHIGLEVVAFVGDPGDCLAATCGFVAFRDGPQSARAGYIDPVLRSLPGSDSFLGFDFTTGSSLYGMTIS